jgi:hypothetical protein
VRLQRTDTIGNMYDSKPGFYMVVGPDWKGEVPAGINSVFRSPTNLAYIIPRAFLDDTKEDRAAIQPVLNQMGGLRSDIACTRRPSTISIGRGGRSGFDLIHSIHEQEFSPLEC